MKKITIGLIRETKVPIDNRVALTPSQCRELIDAFPNLDIIVEPSEIRTFDNQEYIDAGIKVDCQMGKCDYLLGIKEVEISALIPGKHYFFFGHIAKEQDYNRPLCKALINKNITFSDWEYLTDKAGHRVVAFGHWAGIVGAYNALRLYGLRKKLYSLSTPNYKSTIQDFISNCKGAVEILSKKNVNVMITGNGRVAKGAIQLFESIGIDVICVGKETKIKKTGFNIYQLKLENLVCHKDGKSVNSNEFYANPHEYKSIFEETCSNICDILISCHYWQNDAPKYLTKELVPTTKIDTVADITCDINGSIETTIRPSTHDDPFYAIDRNTLQEVSYDSPNSIGVMAIDTCPNALPRDASRGFGEQIIKHLIPQLLEGDSLMVERATIMSGGRLADRYGYLHTYAYD